MTTKTILIVVPETHVSALLAFALSEEGYQVSVADSLQEAEELLANSTFDLIVTDAFNQDSAFVFKAAFIDKLRRVAEDTPIVLCSTFPSTRFLRPAHYGLAGVIARPCLLDGMLAKVNMVLQEVD